METTARARAGVGAAQATPPRRAAPAPAAAAAPVVLGALAAAWVAAFSVLVVWKHARFSSVDFDLGIHDQSVWLLAHFRGFSTVRGLQVFGHHATPAYFLFVPFYWLGAGPHLLNVAQVVVVALGVVPVFLLARLRTASAWIGTALGVAYLLHPALQFFVAELFHPEVMAITPLLAAYYCSVRRRWAWFAVFVVLAVAWKEDLALAVVFLGLLVAWRGDRRIGLVTAAAALAWFLVWVLAVFPVLNGGKIQNEGLYADVGGSPAGMVRTLVTDPGAITSKVVSDDAAALGWRLLAPFGLAALAAPAALVLGAPQAFLNLVTNVPWTKTITFHYAAIPVAAVTIASVEGVGVLVRRLPRRWTGTIAAGLVVASALAATVAWGPSPLGREYRSGVWALDAQPLQENAQVAIARVPPDASVSATYNLVPHLTHRAEIYSFPNPWRSVNFGIDGEPRHRPSGIDWIVADRRVLDEPTGALLSRLVREEKFRVVFDDDAYVVVRRAR